MKMIATVISDTHTKHKNIKLEPKTGENTKNVLIHCGDFSHTPQQVFSFCEWYSEVQGFDYRILIAGNHDGYVKTVGRDEFYKHCEEKGIIYLQDTSVVLHGIKFWGSPMSNEFGPWPFMASDLELDKYWQKIPDDTNVLITHGPAFGKCDDVHQDIAQPNVGSKTLEIKTRELKELTHHFVGHIHDSCGEIYEDEHFLTYNACIMDSFFVPEGKPHTFEIN